MDAKCGLFEARVSKEGIEKMNTQTSSFLAHSQIREDIKSDQTRQETRLTGGICVFAFLALAFGLFGLSMGIAAILNLLDSNSWLPLIGTLALCSAFPLMLLAAHCMDRLSEIRKAARVEYCKKNGLR